MFLWTSQRRVFSYLWCLLTLLQCIFILTALGLESWINLLIFFLFHYVDFIQFTSVTQLCMTLCDPMDCSTPCLPVHHWLLKLAQIHVHPVGDAIQPSHPLLSPSPFAFNLSQHEGLFKWVNSSHQVAKVAELKFQHQSFQWIFKTDFFYFFLIFISWRLITLQYCSGFCHTLTWISHGFTFTFTFTHPDPPSHLPSHPIPLGLLSAPAPSTCLSIQPGLAICFTLDNIYFQCYSLRSSHPHLLPQSPKVCSIYLCLFFCPAYRVIITIFLNSIYMH